MLSAKILIEQGHNAANVERLWEAQMQQLGARAYENTLKDKRGNPVDFHTTAAGKWFLQHAHRVVEAAIEELQASVISDTGANGGGSRRCLDERATLPMVPASSLTGIVLKALIDKTMAVPEERHRGPTMQNVITSVSKAVEMTLKLMCDIQESRADAKAWFEEHGAEIGLKAPPLSIAEKMLKEAGASKMARSRWRGALKEVLEYRWSIAQQYYCGDALVLTAVEALRRDAEARGHPAPFEVHNPPVNSKRAKRVRITAEFAELLEQREIRACEAQTRHLPMLSRPMPWRIEE